MSLSVLWPVSHTCRHTKGKLKPGLGCRQVGKGGPWQVLGTLRKADERSLTKWCLAWAHRGAEHEGSALSTASELQAGVLAAHMGRIQRAAQTR